MRHPAGPFLGSIFAIVVVVMFPRRDRRSVSSSTSARVPREDASL